MLEPPAPDRPDAQVGDPDAGADAFPDATDGAAAGGWTAAGSVETCNFERLIEPAGKQIFSWSACDGPPGCERATFDPEVLKTGGSWKTLNAIYPLSKVHDDGTSIRISLLIVGYLEPQQVWIVDETGTVLDAYRTFDIGDDCRLIGTEMWGDRLAILFNVGMTNSLPKQGLLLAAVGQAAPPTMLVLNTDFLVGHLAMGTTRLGYGFGGRLATLSNATGSDEHVVMQLDPFSGGASALTSSGARFLFDRQMFQPPAPSEIDVTDGIEPATPYLVPPQGSDYFKARWTGSHVAWLRGIDQDIPSGAYGSIEVWSSPFSPNPAELVPQKLGNSTIKYVPGEVVAGWDRFAFRPDIDTVEVWEIPSGTAQEVSAPPNSPWWHLIGLSHSHLWATMDIDGDNAGDELSRFAFP